MDAPDDRLDRARHAELHRAQAGKSDLAEPDRPDRLDGPDRLDRWDERKRFRAKAFRVQGARFQAFHLPRDSQVFVLARPGSAYRDSQPPAHLRRPGRRGPAKGSRRVRASPTLADPAPNNGDRLSNSPVRDRSGNALKRCVSASTPTT